MLLGSRRTSTTMRRAAADAGADEEAGGGGDWATQTASHAAAATSGHKTAGAMAVDRDGDVAALDARKSILLVKLSADGLPVHKSLRHKESRWVVGTNVRWCHAEQHSHLLASTCNSVAFIWNSVAANHPIYALREHKRSVNAISWHPSDGTIATCSADSYIHVWDVRTPPRRPDMSFCAWTAGATCIEWSLGDENVLASSHDNEVRLWDRRKGTLSQPTAFITAHRHNVRSLAWQPGAAGSLLTLGQDGAVKLWDTSEPRECKADLSGKNEIPYSVQHAAWTPFGEGLVTAGDSGMTTLWSLPHGSSGSRRFDEAAVVERVATMSDQSTQEKLRDFAWRSDAPTNRYQLCSLSVTGELRTKSIAADWMARCGHVKNQDKPSERERAPSGSTRGAQAAQYNRAGERVADRQAQSNHQELKKAVEWELGALEENAALKGRVKFDRYTEADPTEWLTARLRIEARKPVQTKNGQHGGRSADPGYMIVDMSFPENYPTGHRVAPKFVFDTKALSASSLIANALEKGVAVLANISVAKQSLCMDKCILAAVQILDGPLGTGQSGNRTDGTDEKANAERERKGYTPCPVLSAGVFSGPGYFVTFNNGLPFVMQGRRTAALADGTSGSSSPPSPPSSRQSPRLHLSMATPPVTPATAGHMDDSPTSLMSPTVAHLNASGIAAATMKREYRSFLQELGRPLQDASKPNLSAMIVGAAATGESSATNEYDVPSTPEQMRMGAGSSAGFSYQGRDSMRCAGASTRGAAVNSMTSALSNWNTVKFADRSYIDLGLAKRYDGTLVDVDCPPRECCKRNAIHAENYGLVEVAQTWVLFALALGSLLRVSGAVETEDETALRLSSWSVHPLGQGFIADIIKRLMHHGDLQTVAVLSCVLHDAEAEVVADTLRLGGARRKVEAARFGVLAGDLQQQCDNFMEEYAMLLRSRGLPLQSAAVRAKRWQEDADDHSMTGGSRRSVVDRNSSEVTGMESTAGGPSCGICNLPVRGLGNTCLACGHIGHSHCLHGWFVHAGMSSCPVGCGCQCGRHVLFGK